MNPFEQRIAAMIGAICRAWQQREVQRFAAAVGVGLVAWLLAMIVLDNLAMLSSGELLLGWAALLAALVALAGLLGYRLTIGRPSADRLALLYEARVPQQRNRLINAVQFVATRAARRDVMVQAVIAENALALDVRSAARAVDPRPVRRTLLVLAGVAVALAGYAALRPAWVRNALARLLQPAHPGVHLLATEPAVKPGDVELIAGDPLTIEATVPTPLRGRAPAAARLEYRVGQLGWMTAGMSTAPDRLQTGPTDRIAFTYAFAAVWQPLEYHVRAGRSVSPTYQVRVQPRPTVSALRLTVTRPAYAGGQTRPLTPNVGDVTALVGSTVAVSLTASVPLSAGRLELSDGTNVPLQLDRGHPEQGQAAFKLQRSGSYAIRLTDTRGLTNVNPPRYTLTAEPDQAPLAAITRPGRDLVLPAGANLELRIEAEDDIGLDRVVLQTRQGGEWQDAQVFPVSPATSTPAAQPDSPETTPGANPKSKIQNPKSFASDATLPLADLGLKVNDVLLYRAVGYDRRQPEPNVGVGRTWSVAIAEADASGMLLQAQTRRLLEALEQILALQRENRAALDLDRPVEPLRDRQQQIRDLTAATIDAERKALHPNERVLAELVALADGPMLQAGQQLADYGGPYAQRQPRKPPLLALMDDIIKRLEALVGLVRDTLARSEQAREALAQLPEQEREQALKNIRDLLEKLRDFVPEQDRVIAETEELVRKGADLTDADRQKLEQLKGTEDKWDDVFTESVKDIGKLTEQGFADRSIANDYKEMVEQIEEASKNLTPDLIQLAVPREQSGRELAQSLVEEMEMWLPSSPDHVKWIMEEPLDFPEIPMVELPDQLSDMIGDLIESQDELNDDAEDVTSAWADSIAEGAGWEVAGGPISNFSAVGKTGNQLPDNNELSGRSGEGRSGRSQGQMVEDVAKGLGGRKTPTRITNDSYEQGVVKELQQMATGGATGGGKARGAGQEGLQGESPPPLYKDLQNMRDWQERIRQEAQRVAGQLQMVRVQMPELEKSIALMKAAEQAAVEGRYRAMFQIQQMVLQNLHMAGDLAAREAALRVDRAHQLPADQRRQILDALDEPVPEEYQDAVHRYFQQLSEGE